MFKLVLGIMFVLVIVVFGGVALSALAAGLSVIIALVVSIGPWIIGAILVIAILKGIFG